MSVRQFLDTNILVYSFDETAPAKRDIARAIIAEALATGNGILSWQVAQEFMNVATRKFRKPMTGEDCAHYLDTVLLPLYHVFPSADIYRDALGIQTAYGYSFYDSLIIAAALAGGCKTLCTEDMQHGQKIRELQIVNPFQ
jgi:predicted nucleic acid-binding protein